MTAVSGGLLSTVGFDAVALKPTEVDIDHAFSLTVETITIDYEGNEHVPGPEELRDLADSFAVRLAIPVRADGFDPLGDDHLAQEVPADISRVLVAGNGAYLSEAEQQRAITPRLKASATSSDDPWIGTEGIERIALALGGTQFELLSSATKNEVSALRTAGYDGEIAVYAPTVLSGDPDTILDALGSYAGRRHTVRQRLSNSVSLDSSISGEDRQTLLAACRAYALTGSPDVVAKQVESLHKSGVDYVVGYPARGLRPL